jgi:uncharacterized protein
MLSLLLACTALATAILSGVFGMAGGMVLMGVYAALLPVASAMVLHGATQLLSNGLRAAILWRDVYWRGLRFYIVGSLAAFALLFQLRYVPDQVMVFFGLGLAPFVAALLPARLLDFERPAAAVLTGAQVAALQVLAGAAGPLLDVAFIDTRLTRTQVVATKAITQVFSHALKLVYFVPFLPARAYAPELVLAILIATLIGTLIGTRILARLTDHTFRVFSRYIVYGIGAFYLSKACFLLL